VIVSNLIWITWRSGHGRLLDLTVKVIVEELVNDLARLYRNSLVIKGNGECTDDLMQWICTEACIKSINNIRNYSSGVMTCDSDLNWKCDSEISGEDGVWRWRDDVPVDIGLTE
jgi:hypothetical protein